MKVLILIILQFGLFLSAYAQEKSTLVFRVGLGNYSMKSQKLFQQDFLRESGIPYRKVHQFPNFPTFGAAAGFKIAPKASMGLWFEFASTGGRLHYKDYSGHAMMDQVLTSFQGGPFAQYRVNKSEEWPLYVTAHGSVATVTERIKSEFQIGGQPEIEQFKLNATNVGIRPGLMLGHAVGVFNFQFGLGVEFRSDGKLKDNEEQFFRTSDGKDLTAEWNGWRVTLGVGIVL
ncbi:hypothetical protein [Lunatibacter salilacus]|uniref:hypothetical protein n=1 Tax=Lunatibacter salilacus TaxID=2483804 RepID=UPI00131D8359|nr:hypothetical protein [Lunatibacter salilacus]